MEKKNRTDMLQTVTVIIPVYNTERYLYDCVDSVLKQTHQQLQIILVDDGSTDGSPILCDEIAKRDPRIEVVHKSNEGLGLTRNKGLEFTKGEYVTFLDSDDWISETHIQNLLEIAVTNHADLVIGSNTKYASEPVESFAKTELSVYGHFEGADVRNKIIPEIVSASDSSRLDMGIPMSVCFNLYKTQIIQGNNITFPSERYCVSEDFFFNYQYMLHCNCIDLIQEYGYYYRRNPVSISHTFSPVQIERVRHFYEEIKKMVLAEPITDNIESRVYRCSLSKVRSMLKRLSISSLSGKEKIKYIRIILNDPMVQEMLQKYDISKYRMSLRLFSLCMKYKMPYATYMFMQINNYRK